MRYGLGFKMGVLTSLKLLDKQESKEYTVREVLNFYVSSHSLNPSKKYLKTLYVRVWRSLMEWCDEGFCSVELKPHPTKHYSVGYYKLKDNER